MTTRAPSRAIGAGSMILALGFNLPYAALAVRFDYPAILREPPEVILERFVAGGPGLVAIWYGFALAALAFIPVGLGLALGAGRVQSDPGLAVTAAVLAALAGLTQAMGLLRWVMVVPGLAAAPDGEAAFAMLHAYAGVAIGEHLGMLLTGGFVATMAMIHRQEGRRGIAGLGGLAAVAIAAGAFEGVAMALGRDGAGLGLAAVAGYLLLTAWLAWEGIALMGPQGRAARQPA